jgi:hypothetical protein
MVLALALTLAGCGTKSGSTNYENRPTAATEQSKSPEPGNYAADGLTRSKQEAQVAKASVPQPTPVSNTPALDQTSANQNAAQAVERKIIRNGKLTIETDDPTAEQSRITSISEAHGGFVVTSDFKQNGSNQANQTVTITVRVPSSQFDDTLGQVRKLGKVTGENVSGQDVTEEFLDLEARIKTQRALEAQFLEIMKQAKTVSDALEVQREIANVRTEIERMEGRKRFLENQASLSTIVITLQTPAPILAASTNGFWHSVKQAFADGVDFAAQLVLGLIRLVIVLIPITLFILLPLGLLLRYLLRRLKTTRKVEAVPQPQE